MTVDEVKAAREVLAACLSKMIVEFEEESGVPVERLEIERPMARTYRGIVSHSDMGKPVVKVRLTWE